MKKLVCLVLSLIIFTIPVYASEEEPYDMPYGIYYIGMDIAPGSYIVRKTEGAESGYIAILSEEVYRKGSDDEMILELEFTDENPTKELRVPFLPQCIVRLRDISLAKAPAVPFAPDSGTE